MPVTPRLSYPGVYVQEVPSGVRTITGVSTSVTAFIGRASEGVLDKPKLCLNYSDFERAFSSDYAKSELARSVRLFFANDGAQAYVMRIAKDAKCAAVTLKNEEQPAQDVLIVKAKSAGVLGNSIRLAVTYKGLQPEATFNLEVFRWTRNKKGALVKTDRETFSNLTMDPNSRDYRYAVDYVTQNSKLIELKLPSNLLDSSFTPPKPNFPKASDEGYSQAGLPVPSRTNAIFKTQWKNLIGKASVNNTNRFLLSVDGSAFVEVDLSSIDFDKDPLETDNKARANLAGEIERVINSYLVAGSQVTATFVPGPTGPSAGNPDNQLTVLLKITSAKGDVKIAPASSKDLAVPLMMGTAQGGVEVARCAKYRPAPNGLVFNLNNLNNLINFAQLKQTAFNKVTVEAVAIGLQKSLVTNTKTTDPRMYYQKDYTQGTAMKIADFVGHSDGVRKKLSLIAAAINKKKDDPKSDFKWSAELWGYRLALIPGEGGENSQGNISSSGADGVDIGAPGATYFLKNVRYYSLGTTGKGSYQSPGDEGDNGKVPGLKEYQNAFKTLKKEVDIINLLVLPSDEEHDLSTRKSLWGPASEFCQEQRAFLIMDPPPDWQSVEDAVAIDPSKGVQSLRVGLVNENSAIFYPRVLVRENERDVEVGPSGAIAGLMARIDSNRGVWKAAAGTEATLRGVVGLKNRFSDEENGILNPRGINTLRVFPQGIVSWGARTMDGDDGFVSDEWKYIPIRRLALYIEESLYRGLKWVVFEPNDEPLWAQIRLNVGAFMNNLFRQGAFQGDTPKKAYFVKCDRETTTQNDRNLGIVNIYVGFAPLKPAEFVVLYLQQMAGQIAT